MSQLIDITGKRFSRILVLSKARIEDGARYWNVVCDCGKEFVTRGSTIRRGETKSCGCLSADRTRARNLTHGLSRTHEYRVWIGMKKRCENPKCKPFKNYGGRGISIEFKSFDEFFNHLGPCPSGYTIERINNDGNYAKGNVKWATRIEQGRNTRHCRYVTIGGTTKTFSEWCDHFGVRRGTAYQRLKYGWSEHRAVGATL